jgi:WD40 repeat protein
LAYSADGRRLVTRVARLEFFASTSQNEIVVHDADTKEARVVAVVSGPLSPFALSGDGRRLAVPTPGGPAPAKGVLLSGVCIALEAWDLEAGKRLWTFDCPKGVSGPPAFSADGQRLAVAEGDAVVARDLATDGKVVHIRPLKEWVANPTLCLAFSPDGRRVLTAGKQRAYVWDTASEEVHDFSLGGRVQQAAFSSDGERLATGDTNGRVILWDVRTGQQILTLRVPRGSVTALAFSPDARRLAAVGTEPGTNNAVTIWDATPPAP